jgi:chemotaxis protein methyltransferase CheR
MMGVTTAALSPGPRAPFDNLALERLLAGVYQKYGFDYRNYARSALKRRLYHCVQREEVATLEDYQERILADATAFERFQLALSAQATSMFRFPGFHLALRQQLVPLLRTYPFIRIWHPGCATGLELYATAIVLREEGLYERSTLYATDVHESALALARAGRYPLEVLQAAEADYRLAGGRSTLAEYYALEEGQALMRPLLRERIMFAQHNLATDASLNEFQLIIVRDVLIHFNTALGERAFRVFHESLCRFGVVALGHGESMHWNPHRASYERLLGDEKMYRKVRC